MELFAAKDGGDENGLKLEKNWPVFFKFGDVVLWKLQKVKYE